VKDLRSGEPVAVATPNGVQGGTFLRDLGDGYVRVWLGSRPARVRRDHVNPTQRPVPIKVYEDLFRGDD
jgi:hypothetical protein